MQTHGRMVCITRVQCISNPSISVEAHLTLIEHAPIHDPHLMHKNKRACCLQSTSMEKLITYYTLRKGIQWAIIVRYYENKIMLWMPKNAQHIPIYSCVDFNREILLEATLCTHTHSIVRCFASNQNHWRDAWRMNIYLAASNRRLLYQSSHDKLASNWCCVGSTIDVFKFKENTIFFHPAAFANIVMRFDFLPDASTMWQKSNSRHLKKEAKTSTLCLAQ